ncbi:MAG: spermine synthase [Proteobacteria bacterium]|nr:spermine synthase [Pseudomonadota bacterium]
MHKTKIIRFILFVFVAGFGGIVAQTILLRELLILFSGNELSIGVIIGSWVIWEAIGAVIGGTCNRKDNPEILVFSIILFSILFPASIYLIRIFKVILSIPAGVGAGLLPVFYSSFLILLPTGILHGFFFTLACSIHNQLTGKRASSVGKVYFYEMLGTIAGGILVSYLFIPYFNSFHVALVVALLSTVSCMIFMLQVFKGNKTGQSGGRKAGLFLFTLILSVSTFIALLYDIDDTLHSTSIKKQWPQQNVVFYENSVYQNIVVVKNEDQYTFFTDGIPFITTPVPDIAFVEELAHFPLLTHPHPENVLILGGGAGGLINEILKHPTVKKTDYVEIDPALLETIRKFSTPLTETELNNPLIRLHYMDGKIFLKETKDRYDVVLIGLPPPSTLQTNRFYTQEFFTMVKSILKTNGILALTMPGSLTYYSSELKELNTSIIETLKSVFSYVFVLPGEYNLLLASHSDTVTGISPSLLYKTLSRQRIETKLITLPHLNYRFEKRWQDWFASAIEDSKASVNRDFSPKGLYYTIAYQNLLFSPSLKSVFDAVKHINFTSVLIFISAVFLLFLLLRKKYTYIGIPYAITTTGFAVMVFELVLMFGFQIFYGYVFYEIGILITIFMGGMAAGSLIVTYRNRWIGAQELSLMKTLDAAMVMFSLLLTLIFSFPEKLSSISPVAIRLIFYILLMISGFFAGMQFPLSNAIYLSRTDPEGSGNTKPVGKTAGMLYGADLVGGWLGGIIGGLIVLPVLGLIQGCILLAVLKATSLILLYTFPKK